MSLIEKFWRGVEKSEECWTWSKYRNKNGYGQFQYRENGKKGNWLAHRFIYFYMNPEADLELCVCHKCDNPSCVRPDHLFLGTQKENMWDRKRKGRYKKKVVDISDMPF